MGKIISNFYLNIYRLKEQYEKESQKDFFSKTLLSEVTYFLANYNADFFEENTDCFYNQTMDLISVEEILVLFVLYSIDSRILDIDDQIRKAIVKCFTTASINPYNFEMYLDLCISPEIYNLLLQIDPNSLAFVIYSLTKKSIVNKNQIINKDDVKKSLEDYISPRISPIFNGNYSLENLYKSLKEIMASYQQYFSPEDFETLNNIPNLVVTDYEKFSNKIAIIEDSYDNDPIETIKSIIAFIRLNFIYGTTNLRLYID